MKTTFFLLLLLSIVFAFPIYALSQETNQWGDQVFGARLSINLDDDTLTNGSRIVLKCTIKNFSTNDVDFVQTYTTGMYKVSLIDDAGRSFVVNDPDNVGDSSEIGNKVAPGKSHESIVAFPLRNKLEPGHYKILATQRVYIFRKPNRQDVQLGMLGSNSLDVQVK